MDFSEEGRKRIIRDDGNILINLYLDDAPYALGHIVVTPRNNAQDIAGLSEDSWGILGQWLPDITNAMKETLELIYSKEVEKIYLCSFNESPDYPVHFHLVPRYKDDATQGEKLLCKAEDTKLTIAPKDKARIVHEMKKQLSGMVTTDVVEAIITALERMDKAYCKLSHRDYAAIDDPVRESALMNKYLERPIAYEFYHQLRRLLEGGRVHFGGCVVQAEVDKRYQHCFKDGKIPDFILHVPSYYQNLAVIEFKLASNIDAIQTDLDKLTQFKSHPDLAYNHLVEIFVGTKEELTKANSLANKLSDSLHQEIIIINFDTDLWQAKQFSIGCKETQRLRNMRSSY